MITSLISNRLRVEIDIIVSAQIFKIVSLDEADAIYMNYLSPI